MIFRLGGIMIAAFALFLTPSQQPSQKQTPKSDTFSMTGPQFWRTPFGENPWIPLAGDADGDGHADLIAIGPEGESRIEIARTSALGKPFGSNIARKSLGNHPLANACGLFHGPVGADVVVVLADGTIRVAWGMAAGTNTYQHDDLAGTVPGELVPKAPTHSVVADFDGDGKADILILGADGKLVLLKGSISIDGIPQFKALPVTSPLVGVRQFAAGPFGVTKRGQCVWLDETGGVWAASLDFKQDGSVGLAKPTYVAKASPDDHVAVGRFRGNKSADILVGQRLLTGGDPKQEMALRDLPTLEVAKTDTAWMAADLVGNGKDALIRHRHAKDRFGSEDVYVHFSYDATDPAKGYYCSSNDGLPDFWKLGIIKPAGIDLAALGCKVGHRDVLVDIERFENEPEDRLRTNFDRVLKYFASLPISNPDGTTGIAMHMIYRTPWPLSKKDEIMGDFDGHFPPLDRRGIVHTVFCQSGGPLVSKINGDNGHSNEGWAEFLHEFGHQLDLHHEAFYPGISPGFPNNSGCALYPSLMSYTYSYHLDDRGEAIGYSDGSLASFLVDQRHLTKRLPFPIDKVHFLSASPYHFRIKAAPDGKGTFVDWNWNGVLEDEVVVADANYSEGADFGPQHTLGKSSTAPVLVSAGGEGRPLLIYGKDSNLVVRTWLGSNRETEGDKWSGEITDGNAKINGDPTAAYVGSNTTWVAYPTAVGTVLRSVMLSSSGTPRIGVPNLIPGTVGAQPTVASFDGNLVLLLWRGSKEFMGIRMIRVGPNGLTLGGERTIDVMSEVPIGAVEGPNTAEGPSLWIGRIQSDGGPNGGRTEVVRYQIDRTGGAKVVYRAWMDGQYIRHRMTLLWRPESGKLPDGRLYQFTGGWQPDKPAQEQWITMNVPYPEMAGGWLLRRYNTPGFLSPSAPGACFFQGDILYAVRRSDNDTLSVAFYGTGACPKPMGDFDDIGHIRDFGLSHSIKEVTK